MSTGYVEIRMTEDGYQTLYSEKYGQTYHSVHGVLQEARHVFIEGCNIDRLLAERGHVDILEVGFGTGFNFLVSASLALQKECALYYCALENDLPSVHQLKKLNHQRLPHIRRLREQMLTALQNGAGQNRLDIAFEQDIRLTLLTGDAPKTALAEERFDAVFLDAFSPDSNPGLWTEPFMKKLYRSLKTGGTLATYSSRGSVRRALSAAGFKVNKRPGPPGKREVLKAVK